MNKLLLDLHNEPIDIHEEQKRLKNKLSHMRQTNIEHQEFKKSHESLESIMIEQQESSEFLIKTYHDLLKNQHERMEELSENTNELKQQLSMLEAHAVTPLKIPNPNLSQNELIAHTYSEVNRLREAASIFLQSAADKEQYNSGLKNSVDNYAQMVKALKDNPMDVSHETLVQAYEQIVKKHADIIEEYLGIFEEIATSLPKMLCDFADAQQNNMDNMVEVIQTMDAIRKLESQKRDRRIIEDLHNGSLGKYMEGDLPFINYLNFRGALAVIDIDHVSKEVEKGKVKDRGVSELINLLQEHDIQIAYQDAFLLRLLLVEHHKVVKESTKNNKLDYTKNYLNQHKSLSDKAIAVGTTVSAPLRNSNELKVHIHSILAQYSGENGYARDAMMDLLDNQITRLPKKSTSI